MPNITDVHVDQPLSNFAVEYRGRDFIADQVLPVVPVPKKSDKYFVYDQKDHFTRPQTIRGPKAKANEVDWNVSNSNYSCIDYALAEFISDALIANTDQPIVPRQKTVGQLTDLILLDREMRVASLAFTAGNYGANYKTTLAGNNQWSAYATSDPIGNIDTGKAACFLEPNVLIVGKAVWDKLKRHPQVIDKIKGGATSNLPALVTPQLVAEILELERIIIGKAKYNSENKGQTSAYSYIWGKFALLAYIDPNPSMIGVTYGKTFQWEQMATNVGYQVRSWRDESRGGGGEQLEVETSFDEKMVCTDVAYLISGAVA